MSGEMGFGILAGSGDGFTFWPLLTMTWDLGHHNNGVWCRHGRSYRHERGINRLFLVTVC